MTDSELTVVDGAAEVFGVFLTVLFLLGLASASALCASAVELLSSVALAAAGAALRRRVRFAFGAAASVAVLSALTD